MRQAMHELGLLPDHVLVSPAPRARAPLGGLGPGDAPPLVEPVEALYLASAEQLLAVLHGVPETVRSVLLIGHNPGLHELAMTLPDGPATKHPDEAAKRLAAGFPTGALAEFAVAGSWAQLDAGGGRLLRFLAPRDLPHAAA